LRFHPDPAKIQVMNFIPRASFFLLLFSVMILGGLVTHVVRAEDISFEKIKAKADQGDAEAQYKTAVEYFKGQTVPQDYGKAAEYYAKAAAKGNFMAQNNLGNLYLNGQGVKQSDEEALKWFRKAAEKGDSFGYQNVAWMIAHGRGTTGDAVEALKWYEKAAEGGVVDAQLRVGQAYAAGDGGAPQDYKKAVYFLTKAARQGNANAQNSLGILYIGGRGVPRDLAAAKDLLEKAALAGVAKAQANLGNLYADNAAGYYDKVRAFFWFSLAEEQKEITGAKGIADLGGLSPAEMGKAQKLLEDYHQKHPTKN
jgi:TPR repeat protein